MKSGPSCTVVARPAVARLRVVAALRLDRLGIDLDDPDDRPAVLQRIGPSVGVVAAVVASATVWLLVARLSRRARIWRVRPRIL